MQTLRPAVSDTDYRRVLQIRNRVFDYDPLTEEESRAQDLERVGERRFERFSIGDDGYALIGETRASAKAIFMQAFGLDPASLSLDAAYAELLSIAKDWGGSHLITLVLSKQERDIQRLVDGGFAVQQTNPLSMLDVAAFDLTTYEPTDGLEILPFAALQERCGRDWRHRLWRLEMDLYRDVPNPLPFEETPFEKYEARTSLPGYNADTRFAALIGDDLVGMTELDIRRANPQLAMTHLTGVRKEHRRKGIAKALKVEAIATARRRGGPPPVH